MRLVRRLLDIVDEAVQLDRFIEVGLTGIALTDGASELVVHLANIVNGATGHPFEHVGVVGRDRQVFQGVAALSALQSDTVVVRRLFGGRDQGALTSVNLHTVTAADPRVAGDVHRCNAAVGQPTADQNVVGGGYIHHLVGVGFVPLVGLGADHR